MRGKVRERWIAGELDDAVSADLICQRAALLFGALVAPDQGRTHHLVALIEHDRTVHLSREANASDLGATEFCLAESLANCHATGPPPICRMLLCPADPWRGKRLVPLHGGGNHLATLVDHERTGPACADVDAEQKCCRSRHGRLSVTPPARHIKAAPTQDSAFHNVLNEIGHVSSAIAIIETSISQRGSNHVCPTFCWLAVRSEEHR